MSNCYYHQDLHPGALHPRSLARLRRPNARRPPTRRHVEIVFRRRGPGTSLKRHPFSGPVHSAGGLLHDPYRVPTSMAPVLLSRCTNTVWLFPLSECVRHLNRRLWLTPRRQFCLPKMAH